MNAALREECVTLRALFAKASTDEIRTRHRIGRIVLGVQRGPARYGAGAVDRLGAALRCDRATLYRHAQVARCFGVAQVERVLRRAAASAPGFSWSHLVVLSGIDDESVRERLLARALDGLSVRELERALREPQSDGASSASVQRLRRLCAATELFKGRASIDVDVDAEAATDEIVQLLGKLAAMQDELREICERNVRSLRDAQSELARRLRPRLAPRRSDSRPRLLAG